MLVLVVTGIAVLVGHAVGGRPGALATAPIHWWWVGLVAVAVQLGVVYVGGPEAGALGAAVLLASHAGLVGVAAVNARKGRLAVPFAALGLGVALNLSVMAANGGWMPVAPETLVAGGRTESWKVGDLLPGTRVAHSKDVILRPADTRLEALADRFMTGLPGRLNVIFSLGDVVILTGVGALVVRAMTAPARATVAA
ncbi:MAG TPA: DUF5317 family protein [Chloroflexota bacterium]